MVWAERNQWEILSHIAKKHMPKTTSDRSQLQEKNTGFSIKTKKFVLFKIKNGFEF